MLMLMSRTAMCTEADALNTGMQAGLVHFTRSVSGRLAKAGINLYCLCPQFVDTPLVSSVKRLGQSMPEMGSQLLTPQQVHLISSWCPCLILVIYVETDVSFAVMPACFPTA